MTDLAARAFSSGSGMTRRIDRLVDEGLVRRSSADADARGVVVALTDSFLTRLSGTNARPSAQRVGGVFIERLDDQELAVLERALDKVTLDCSFG
jgi:DNA-binding MarR family transcriptional regulator